MSLSKTQYHVHFPELTGHVSASNAVKKEHVAVHAASGI